jgi:Cu-Zn family superoxide dismutase
MHRQLLTVPIAACLLASVSAQTPASRPSGASTGAPTAHASLRSATGQAVGSVLLRDTPNGILLKVDLTAAEPGAHGFHIHETGRCEAPAFQSAGGHYAGGGSEHGLIDTPRPHAGDLPNVHVPQDGRLSFEVLAPGVTLREGARSLFDSDGSALVLHRNPDDYASEPAGNAGDRIACGVIERQ